MGKGGSERMILVSRHGYGYENGGGNIVGRCRSRSPHLLRDNEKMREA